MKSFHVTSEIKQLILLNGNELSVSLYIKRDDLIGQSLNGNKWFKLKHNLHKAKNENYEKLLTFGGAFSNHIYSTAAAGKLFRIKTIGIIRGEEHLPLNPTLAFAKKMGMELHYISRGLYRKKNDQLFLQNLVNQFGNVYIIPEGGTNDLAIKGASEILDNVADHYDYICVSCGTGGTIAGLISSAKSSRSKIIGFAALKGAVFLKNDITKLVKNYTGKYYNNWDVNLEYHFGGYAKVNQELISFMKMFEIKTGILLDPVYTAKMFFGIMDLIKMNFFPKGSKVLAIHTGGIQGRNGMQHIL